MPRTPSGDKQPALGFTIAATGHTSLTANGVADRSTQSVIRGLEVRRGEILVDEDVDLRLRAPMPNQTRCLGSYLLFAYGYLELTPEEEQSLLAFDPCNRPIEWFGSEDLYLDRERLVLAQVALRSSRVFEKRYGSGQTIETVDTESNSEQ